MTRIVLPADSGLIVYLSFVMRFRCAASLGPQICFIRAVEKCFPTTSSLVILEAVFGCAIFRFQEAANRLEGKVESSDESAGNVVFNITISAPRPPRPAIGDGSGHDERDRR